VYIEPGTFFLKEKTLKDNEGLNEVIVKTTPLPWDISAQNTRFRGGGCVF